MGPGVVLEGCGNLAPKGSRSQDRPDNSHRYIEYAIPAHPLCSSQVNSY